MNRSGTTLFRCANLIDTDDLVILAESDEYANFENPGDDPAVNIVYEGVLVDDPVGEARTLPSYLFPVLFQPNGQDGGTLDRPTTNDIGATE